MLSIVITIKANNITEIDQRINTAIAVGTFWSAIFVAFTLMASIKYNEYNIEQQNKIALYKERMDCIEALNKYFTDISKDLKKSKPIYLHNIDEPIENIILNVSMLFGKEIEKQIKDKIDIIQQMLVASPDSSTIRIGEKEFKNYEELKNDIKYPDITGGSQYFKLAKEIRDILLKESRLVE